ncbi:hypothetical protein [Aquirufa sp. Wall-65K1]
MAEVIEATFYEFDSSAPSRASGAFLTLTFTLRKIFVVWNALKQKMAEVLEATFYEFVFSAPSRASGACLTLTLHLQKDFCGVECIKTLGG